MVKKSRTKDSNTAAETLARVGSQPNELQKVFSAVARPNGNDREIVCTNAELNIATCGCAMSHAKNEQGNTCDSREWTGSGAPGLATLRVSRWLPHDGTKRVGHDK